MDTTKVVAHRARQARRVAWRAQLALSALQALFWVTVIGAVLGLVGWAVHRLTRSEHTSAPVTPVEADAEHHPSTTLP